LAGIGAKSFLGSRKCAGKGGSGRGWRKQREKPDYEDENEDEDD
jgi:hypothetical protein